MNWKLVFCSVAVLAGALLTEGQLNDARSAAGGPQPQMVADEVGIGERRPVAFAPIEIPPNFLEKRMAEKASKFAENWGALPQMRIPTGHVLRLGDSGTRVALLRDRLGLAPGNLFDAELATKIADYRLAHGLASGSQADRNLIKSLNLGFAHFQDIIALNIDRLSKIPSNLGPRFVLVDIADQKLHMYEGDQVVGSMRVVVGKSSDQTPTISGLLNYSVVNPYWNIPPDLTRDRFAPRTLREGRSYLDSRRFEALSGWEDGARVLAHGEVDWRAVANGTTKLRMRQRPGPGNGMGKIKFTFPNQLGIYLHDTPSVSLFKKDQRTFSAGCIRVERPWKLAEWLHGTRPQAQGTSPEQKVKIDHPVPIYITYFTAIPTQHGFAFRKDIYQRDHKLLAALTDQDTDR